MLILFSCGEEPSPKVETWSLVVNNVRENETFLHLSLSDYNICKIWVDTLEVNETYIVKGQKYGPLQYDLDVYEIGSGQKLYNDRFFPNDTSVKEIVFNITNDDSSDVYVKHYDWIVVESELCKIQDD